MVVVVGLFPPNDGELLPNADGPPGFDPNNEFEDVILPSNLPVGFVVPLPNKPVVGAVFVVDPNKSIDIAEIATLPPPNKPPPIFLGWVVVPNLSVDKNPIVVPEGCQNPPKPLDVPGSIITLPNSVIIPPTPILVLPPNLLLAMMVYFSLGM